MYGVFPVICFKFDTKLSVATKLHFQTKGGSLRINLTLLPATPCISWMLYDGEVG